CLVNFAVKPGLSSTILLYEFDPQGRLVHRHSHAVPGFAFLHDFAITPNYCLFFQNPVSFNPVPYAIGLKGAAECISFNPKQPTQAILIPRNGKDPVQFIEAPPSFVFHHANAFEADGKVYLDSICYREFPTLKGGEDYRQVNFDAVPEGQLWRFELDLAQGKATETCLIERCCEFPVLHPDRVGRPYRYLYMGAALRSRGNAPLQALLKRDLETGADQLWTLGARGFMGEPNFVPHPQGQAEDDGWVLMLLYDAAEQRSELAILAAKDITAGPIARLKLKHHVPYGLHGSFTSQYFGPDAKA
ncbi:MAG: Apocarotenoid-15,15'-oxygenase, partial [Leptolyngbya sp. SIO4C1]|nr:Apocarotenoid-15,15'-oxygenase [Leptolyngbya sp. SIO4C1]